MFKKTVLGYLGVVTHFIKLLKVIQRIYTVTIEMNTVGNNTWRLNDAHLVLWTQNETRKPPITASQKC